MILTPKQTKQESLDILANHGLSLETHKLLMLAVRGYYKNTFGKPNADDRKVYDDALFIISDNYYKAIQWNTNPSPTYKHGLAELITGLYDVKKHRHKGKYNAFQIIEAKVKRDGKSGVFVGNFGINLHYDGEYIPSGSLGCQTGRKSEFIKWQPQVYNLMDSLKLTTFKYLLV